jgi:hypothetical protein
MILYMQACVGWVIFTASGISSGVYHASDLGTWCALNFNVLQVTKGVQNCLYLFCQVHLKENNVSCLDSHKIMFLIDFEIGQQC